jgi:hypothetical protein
VKLRIQENSVRLRLDETELSELVETGRLRRSIRFGPGDEQCLAYTLEVSDRGSPADAELRGAEIRVFVRAEDARRLEAGAEVSVEGTRKTGENEVLRVLIERDFAP